MVEGGSREAEVERSDCHYCVSAEERNISAMCEVPEFPSVNKPITYTDEYVFDGFIIVS